MMQEFLTWLAKFVELLVVLYAAISFIRYLLYPVRSPNHTAPPEPEPLLEQLPQSEPLLASELPLPSELPSELEPEPLLASAALPDAPIVSPPPELPASSQLAEAPVETVQPTMPSEPVEPSEDQAAAAQAGAGHSATRSSDTVHPATVQPVAMQPATVQVRVPSQPDPKELDQDTLAEQLLELAAKSGAEAAEVFQSRSLARPVFFEANRLKQLESAQAEGMALRLWKAGRPGLAVAYGPVEPQILVDRAIALSQLNEAEPIELASASKLFYPDLGEAVAVEQLVEWGKQAIALVREAYPEILCTAEWECEAETIRLINSQGLDCGYTDTTLGCYLSAEWVRGDDFLSVSDGQTQRGSLDPAAIAQQILQRLDWAKDNVPSATGRLPILFTSKAADMLWGTVQAALSGKQVIEGASPWSDRLNQPVMSESITISQKPDVGPYSCPFDDEGTPTRPITFIENGILKLFYTDRTTGRALGSGTTGNGFRPGLGSYPTPGMFNCLIEPGGRSRNHATPKSLPELIASLQEGLIVDQMLGGGAGISGEFSVNVDLGYWVRNGQVIGRVKDTMVSGNVYTALKQLIELGGDADWNGSCYTPSLIVGGLSVTGRG